MDYGPLVVEEIEAGLELAREFDKTYPVRAAFWLKASDEGQRYLYLASDRIDDSNFDVAYREIGRIVRASPNANLNQFRIKVLGSHEPRARAAIELLTRSRGRAPTSFGDRFFGDITIDDGYLYPSPLPTPATHDASQTPS